MGYRGFFQWHNDGDQDMFFAVVAADNGYIYYVTDDSPHNSVLDIEFYHFLTASTTDSEWIRRL